VRAEFLTEGDKLSVTVVSTKPGGSDRTVFQGDDAQRLHLALQMERSWQPLLDFERQAIEEAAAAKAKEEALNKPTTKKGKK
jgi:hypothetical protein